MRLANKSHKPIIKKILTESFFDNKSVNYVVKQDNRKLKRIANLASYSFDVCFDFGEVYITDDNKGCALVLFPDKKKLTFKHLLLDILLATRTLGIANLAKTTKRENAIAKCQPNGSLYHIWYIGVSPTEQGKGLGTHLLKYLLSKADEYKRIPVLETSTIRNVPWYEKNGFKIYHEIDLGFPLYCFKMEP